MESAEERMNILEAYDLTGTLRDTTELAGSHYTAARYVAEQERSQAGRRAAGMIDEFLPKLEELIKQSRGEDPRRRGPRQDHRDGALLGPGAPRGGWWRSPTLAWHSGRRRVFCLRVPEPGMRRQYDFGWLRIGATARVPDA